MSTRQRPTKFKPSSVIYHGDRGSKFHAHIKSILSLAGIAADKHAMFMTDAYLRLWGQTFTSKYADPTRNYEALEAVGDRLMGACAAMYFAARFPQLLNPDGAGASYLGRLQITYGSKPIYAQLSRTMGNWDFISADEKSREENYLSLLEDVLEAIFFTLHVICMREYQDVGTGFTVCAKFFKTIFDPVPISLKGKDLMDSISLLKEFVDTLFPAAEYPTLEGVGVQYNFTPTMDGKIVADIRVPISVQPGRAKFDYFVTSQTFDTNQQSVARHGIARVAVEELEKKGYKITAKAFSLYG
jgi:hypothetical protein